MQAISGVYTAAVPVDRMLANLDLNLLVTLDALLRERNVTRTAEALGVSQPAVSAALARLRRHFGDPLLARAGNRYQLTPLAAQLLALTEPAIAGVRRVFDVTPDFDPSSVEREFTIITSDYAATVLGPLIARRLAEAAPGVRLRLQQTTPYTVDHAADTLRTADGLLLPHGFLTDLPYTDLFTDSWVIIAADDHPSLGDAVTLDDIARQPWVFTYQSRSAFTSATRQIQQLGIEPRVETVVESFLAMPLFIAGTDRLGLLQAGLADYARSLGGVRVLEPPFDATPIHNAMWWHPVHRRDPEHEWLRTLAVEAASGLHDAAA